MNEYIFSRGEAGKGNFPLAKIDFDKMLKDKQNRTKEYMKKYGLSSIVCLADYNIAYVSNVPPMSGTATGIGGNRYAIFTISDDAVVFEECDGAFHLRQQMQGIRFEYAIPAWGGPFQASAPEAQEYLLKNFAEQVAAILKEYKVDKEKVGIDVNLPPVIKALEKEGLQVTPDGGKALLEARSVKTPEEVECVRALAQTIDGVFAVMARELRPGKTEREVFAKCVAYAIEMGLEPFGGYIVSGQHTWPKDITRQASDRKIRPGDVVYADFFNFGFFGYRSCYYRTFSVGRASREVRETYQRVYDWLVEAEKVLRPGVTTKDVVEKWPDEREIWGNRPPYIRTEKETLSTFFNNMGHSIGLHIYEIPFFWRPLSLKWPQRIEANMTIALETQDGTPDNRFGVRIEDMIVVTEGGYEVISKWPAEEITEVPLY